MVGSATYTVAYAYEDAVWKDRLTAYNDNEITYDTIGNPVTWHNNADLTWENGRQLVGYTKGSKAYTYTYNDEGIRTSKTVNGVTTTYTVVDGVLRRMTIGSGETATTLQFFDNSVLYNGTEYWYVFNAQNDVVGLIDNTGAYVVEYTYNAWGRLLSTTGTLAETLGKDNPFRYRGYTYDEETGWYYCQSRYYDPAIGRFLNADGQITTTQGIGGYNLFQYCGNNSVMRVDPAGDSWLLLGLLVVGCLLLSGCDTNDTVGSAPDYIEYQPDTNATRDNTPNCYSYAIGNYDASYDPGDFSEKYTELTVDSVADAVLSDMDALGREARIIENYNSPIKENEYRIALRVSKPQARFTPLGSYLDWDYHFMVQTSDGGWAEKHGPQGGTEHYSQGNPNTISWDLGDIEGYYTSPIVYFAITN